MIERKNVGEISEQAECDALGQAIVREENVAGAYVLLGKARRIFVRFFEFWARSIVFSVRNRSCVSGIIPGFSATAPQKIKFFYPQALAILPCST